MDKKVNTLVIGAGCLGVASAVSTKRRLKKISPGDNEVCILDKSLIGSGITSRQSGIFRSANAVPKAAKLSKDSADYWHNLEELWGIAIDFEKNGAIWIARDAGNGDNPKWARLSESMKKLDIDFNLITQDKAANICGNSVTLHDNEVYYYEPDAFQFDPNIVRKTLYKALEINDVDTCEKISVHGFVTKNDDTIERVITSEGEITCKHVVNAAAAWSPSIFKSLGLFIPISTEAVNVVNWLTSHNDFKEQMPILADYTNLSYFRTWNNCEIHMHQPRHRNIKETARIFSEHPLDVIGADFVTDPTNYSLGYAQIRIYEDIVKKRFKGIDNKMYGSGFRSYFDITPDLKFILGRDNKIKNLFHCLGAGQSFKYTPVFGEIIADSITGSGKYIDDIDEFSIDRFDDKYMQYFWSQVSGFGNSLKTDSEYL